MSNIYISIGFYENVSAVTEAEEKLYDPIVEWLQTYVLSPIYVHLLLLTILRSSETAQSHTRMQHSAITSPTLSDRSRASNESNHCQQEKTHHRHRHSSSSSSSSDTPTQQMDKEKLKKQLMARWRYPTLSVHKIDVSFSNPTIIPRCAKAFVSMRVVPDQTIADISSKFEQHVCRVFSDLQSDNVISVSQKQKDTKNERLIRQIGANRELSRVLARQS